MPGFVGCRGSAAGDSHVACHAGVYVCICAELNIVVEGTMDIYIYINLTKAIYIYIYIYAVKLLSGPSLAILGVIIWAK